MNTIRRLDAITSVMNALIVLIDLYVMGKTGLGL